MFRINSTSHPRNSTPIQGIQRGTNRPFGKGQKTKNSKSKATRARTDEGTCQTDGMICNEFTVVFAPCNTSISETSKASQSLDLRQKISTATMNHTRRRRYQGRG